MTAERIVDYKHVAEVMNGVGGEVHRRVVEFLEETGKINGGDVLPQVRFEDTEDSRRALLKFGIEVLPNGIGVPAASVRERTPFGFTLPVVQVHPVVIAHCGRWRGETQMKYSEYHDALRLMVEEIIYPIGGRVDRVDFRQIYSQVEDLVEGFKR